VYSLNNSYSRRKSADNLLLNVFSKISLSILVCEIDIDIYMYI